MVEELDGLSIEGEIPEMLIVEEVDGVFVEFEGERLQKRDVVGQDFLIRKVQFEHNDGVYVIVGQ